MTVTINVDIAEDLPTLEQLDQYRISEMRVIRVGPGGGNPDVTLVFETRETAVRWLTVVYNCDAQDVDTYIVKETPC